jgi:transcriptional regulator with XRE-family HTH domain
MSKQGSDSELRREIARRLKDAIRDNNLTKSRAAELLKVKRQTLWLYLNGRATPGGEVLRRAFELWDIKLVLGGLVITKESLGPIVTSDLKLPEQLNLLDQLDKLTNDQLEVTSVGRRGEYFEFRIRIRSLPSGVPNPRVAPGG